MPSLVKWKWSLQQESYEGWIDSTFPVAANSQCLGWHSSNFCFHRSLGYLPLYSALTGRISVSFGCVLQTQAKGCGPHSFLSASLFGRDFSSQLLSLPCEMKDNLHWEFFTLLIMSSKLKMQSFDRGTCTSAPLIIVKEDTDIKQQ